MKSTLAALTMATCLASAAGATTLDFNGMICSGGQACTNGAAIDQSYGDIAGVDVEYDGNPSTSGLQDFRFWGDSYSGLTSVAYYGAGATLTLLGIGGGVSLTSLDLGAWPNSDRQLGFSVVDLASNLEVFLVPGNTVVLGSTPSSFLMNLNSTAGFRITFLGDFFNGGVDNVVYDATRPVTPPVPLPAAGWLMLAGLGALAAARRMRR